MSTEVRVSEPVKIERAPVPVMFMRATGDTPTAIQQAWAKFEAAVGLTRRKFFGAFDGRAGGYRVCVQLTPDDDPDALGLEVATLPGGTYLRVRLRGEPPTIYDEIPSVVQQLVKRSAVDRSRPTIEFYRRRDMIDLLLPIS